MSSHFLPVAVASTISAAALPAIAAPTIQSVGCLSQYETYATAINDGGTVTGVTSPPSFTPQEAFHWNSPGPLVSLGAMAGMSVRPAAINNNGEIAGVAYSNSPYQRRAFRLQSGTYSDLGTLGGSVAEAKDISDSGVIVGWSENAIGRTRAFVYEGGAIREIATPGNFGQANAINNSNVVVG